MNAVINQIRKHYNTLTGWNDEAVVIAAELRQSHTQDELIMARQEAVVIFKQSAAEWNRKIQNLTTDGFAVVETGQSEMLRDSRVVAILATAIQSR